MRTLPAVTERTPARAATPLFLAVVITAVLAVAGAGCDDSASSGGSVVVAGNTVEPAPPGGSAEPLPAAPDSNDPVSAGPAAAPAAPSVAPAVPVATPEEPPAAIKPGGTPGIVFEAVQQDLGTFPETEKRSTSFAFTNAGDARLEIRSLKTSCGCAAATPSKTEYAPGESGEISVEFKPTAPGANQRQYITVVTNAEGPPPRLMITANVEAFIVIEPRMIEFGVVPYRYGTTTTVTVTCPDEEFVIQNVATTSRYVSARIVPDGSPRGPKTIEVTVAPDIPWGGFATRLAVTARGRPAPGEEPIIHTSKIRVQGKAFGQLAAEPDAFRFGVKPNEVFERRLKISHRSGTPFEIVRTAVSSGNIPGARVRVEQISESSYELILTASGATRPMQGRGVVLITTTVTGEETLEIPIVGVVRAP